MLLCRRLLRSIGDRVRMVLIVGSLVGWLVGWHPTVYLGTVGTCGYVPAYIVGKVAVRCVDRW